MTIFTQTQLSKALQPSAIFLLALIPRMIALQQFVTADEAKWVYRSAQFLAALLRGEYSDTAVNLTPAVTTTWLGSLGLSLYYQLSQSVIDLPFLAWLETLPPFRAELPIIAAVRWPIVIFSSVTIVLIYFLAKRLWGNPIAFLGAALIALDPHFIALSRIIGHDAPVTVFMTLSLLALLIALRNKSTLIGWLISSGMMAGLAFLSKSPALFLLPFTTLICFLNGGRIFQRVKPVLIWSVIAYAVFAALWPAVWVAPVQQPYAVVENAFLSATNLDEVAAGEAQEREVYWLVPDLGPFYYFVNTAFKLSPLVSIGLAVGVVSVVRQLSQLRWQQWIEDDRGKLLLFVLLFLIFMTLGGKRSNRYILPIFPALAFLAAWGWSRVSILKQPMIKIPAALASLCLIGILLLFPYIPYYYTYFNPLLGGPLTAPHLIKVGWGEGLDKVGHWLDAQPAAESSRVGSWYASTLDPFYRGDIADVQSERLDYIVLYRKQLQGGAPNPEIGQYFQSLAPLHTVRLSGIDYAWIYPGPAAQSVLANETGASMPIAYRPHRAYAPIGDTLLIDLIWPNAANSLPVTAPSLGLRWKDVEMTRASAAVQNSMLASNVVHYQLKIPAELPATTVELWLANRLLGTMPAYHDQPPDYYFTLVQATFGDQIQLVGFDPNITIADDQLRVSLAFQATPKVWADYTVFVHLITSAGERLTGHDAPPTPTTSQWAKAQVVQDTHRFTLPENLSKDAIYQLRIGLYQTETLEPLGEPYILPVEVRLP